MMNDLVKAFLLFFILTLSEALAQQPSFYHFSKPGELKELSVNEMMKDSRGFMWIGTYDGVKKFDGYTLIHYLNTPDSLGSRDVRHLYEDENGIIYMGTYQSGLFTFNPYTDTFTHYVHKYSDPKSLSSNSIHSIHSNNGVIYITTNKGVDILNAEQHSFERINLSKKTNDDFLSSVKGNENNIWLSGTKGIYEYNLTTKKIDLKKRFSTPADNMYPNIYCDQNNTIWVSSSQLGLVSYHTFSGKYIEYKDTDFRIGKEIITEIIEDQNHALWISTNGNGLYKYTPSTNEFNHFKHQPGNRKSIHSNSIHTLYEDNDGTLWVGFFKQGIDIVNGVSTKFNLITEKTDDAPGLSNKSVLSIAENKDKIYLGTDGGGIDVLNSETNEIFPLEGLRTNKSRLVVKSLSMESPSTLWVGTFRKGVKKLNLDSQKIEASYFESESMWSLLFSEGYLWVGTLRNGLKILNTKTGQVEHYSFKNHSYNTSVAVQKIFKDSKNNIWICTTNAGLFCFLKGKKLIRVDENINIKLNVRDIAEDDLGNIWVATGYSGLGLIKDLEKKEIEFFTQKHGISSNTCVSLGIDNTNNIWIATNKGLSHFKSSSKTFSNFQVPDGLQGHFFNEGSKLISSNGKLYFGGPNGLNYFNPLTIPMNRVEPQIAITDFKLFNKSLASEKDRINTNINVTKEITIDHEENSFTIEFAALSYILPEKNQFAYKLVPFDDNWIYADATKRFATYTNLSPGTYYFRVMASNNDGKWNSKAKELKIIITPAWYKTWWFKFILVTLFLGGLILAFYLRLRSIRSQNIILEELVKNKTATLSQKNEILKEINEELIKQSKRNSEQSKEIVSQNDKLEELNKTKDKLFSIVAHDLKNPVNALSLLVSLLKENYTHDESETLILNDIETSTENIKLLILNLLEWAKSQSKALKINPKHSALNPIILENTRLFKVQLEHKGITMKNNTPANLLIYGDKDMINTIFRNLFSNYCKHLPNNSTIEINTRLNEEQLTVELIDSGHGFVKDFIDNFDQYTYTNSLTSGLGLTLCKEFTKLNFGDITIANKETGQGAIIKLSFEGKIGDPEHVSAPPAPMKPNISFQDLIQEEFDGKKVVLVEDNAALRNSIKLLLEQRFEVFDTEIVKEGLALAEKEEVDLIISDIMLPGDNGINLCNKVKSNPAISHIPVVLITAETSDEIHHSGLIAGADLYIKKPFKETIFLSSINNLLLSLEKLKSRFNTEPLFDTTRITKSEPDQTLLKETIAFIEENISNSELNGDMLSHELGMSKSVLYVKIKKMTGMTVNEFIRTVRLKNSVPLIISENYSMSEVAAMIGFNSPSYFSKSFTSQFGLSPKEYVSKHSKEVKN